MEKFFAKLLSVASRLMGIGAALWAVFVALFDIASEAISRATAWALENFQEIPAFPDVATFQMSEAMGILSIANNFFPVAETWALLVFTVPYMFVIVIFRFIKQFIPTASN